MKKQSNSKYQYAIYLGVGTFLAILLVSFLGIRPLYQNAKNKTADRRSKQENLEYLIDKKEKLENLKSKSEQLEKDAKIVEDALPTQEDVGRLFIQFDRTALSSDGSIKSMSKSNDVASGESVGSSNIKKVTFTSTGSFNFYSGLKDFISKNSTALRIVDITNLKIESGKDGTLNVNLTADTYVR